MANRIKVLFWLHRSKTNKDGLTPLILRLSNNNKKVEKATGYYINANDWNIQKQRLKGNKENNAAINNWIDKFIVKLTKIVARYQDDENIYLPTLLEQLFAITKVEPTILQLISDHNEQIKLRVGKDYSHSTYEKYVFTFNKVKAFIENFYGKNDISLKSIDTKFIMDFDHYLRVNDSNKHNTTVKYCLNLKRVMNVAVLQGLLVTNPMNKFKTVYKDTAQVYLSKAEVETIEKTVLTKAKYILVRDLFIFQCNTGLAYTDMINLLHSDISIDHNGKSWIVKARQKTGIVSTIPLMSM